MAIRKVDDPANVEYRAEAFDNLRRWFPSGATVHAVYMGGNSSGDGHTIKLLAVVNGEVFNASYAVARVVGWSYDDERGGVRVRGGGMDMTAHAVMTLAKLLHDDSYALNYRRV